MEAEKEIIEPNWDFISWNQQASQQKKQVAKKLLAIVPKIIHLLVEWQIRIFEGGPIRKKIIPAIPV